MRRHTTPLFTAGVYPRLPYEGQNRMQSAMPNHRLQSTGKTNSPSFPEYGGHELP